MKEIMADETTGVAYLLKRMVEMRMNPVMTYYMRAVSYVVSVAMQRVSQEPVAGSLRGA